MNEKKSAFVGVRLDETLVLALTALASERKTTLSEMIREAVKIYLAVDSAVEKTKNAP